MRNAEEKYSLYLTLGGLMKSAIFAVCLFSLSSISMGDECGWSIVSDQVTRVSEGWGCPVYNVPGISYGTTITTTHTVTQHNSCTGEIRQSTYKTRECRY